MMWYKRNVGERGKGIDPNSEFLCAVTRRTENLKENTFVLENFYSRAHNFWNK